MHFLGSGIQIRKSVCTFRTKALFRHGIMGLGRSTGLFIKYIAFLIAELELIPLFFGQKAYYLRKTFRVRIKSRLKNVFRTN